MYRWHAAIAAVNTTTVRIGDKGPRTDKDAQERQRKLHEKYNAGTVPDIINEGAAPGGRDHLDEIKVKESLTPSAVGTGIRGGIARLGHLFGFGSIEEELTSEVLGFEAREGDGHFDQDQAHHALRGVPTRSRFA